MEIACCLLADWAIWLIGWARCWGPHSGAGTLAGGLVPQQDALRPPLRRVVGALEEHGVPPGGELCAGRSFGTGKGEWGGDSYGRAREGRVGVGSTREWGKPPIHTILYPMTPPLLH